MRYDTKEAGVMAGDVVLEVKSKYTKRSDASVKLFTLSGVLLILLFVLLLYLKSHDLFLLLLTLTLALPFTLLVLAVTAAFSNFGNPLIITENGVVMRPYVAEYWNDLDGYLFIEYKGAERLTISKSGTGISLRLHNKGLHQRSLTWRGHSIIALNGIFFTDEEIDIARKVFEERGVTEQRW